MPFQAGYCEFQCLAVGAALLCLLPVAGPADAGEVALCAYGRLRRGSRRLTGTLAIVA